MNTHAPEAQGPNCWQCQHFGMSYVPQMPYACRLMGFQSRALPSLEVLRADGRFCRGFAAKTLPVPPHIPAHRACTPDAHSCLSDFRQRTVSKA